MIDLSVNQLAIVQKILAKQLPTTKVWVFGSRIKGTTKPYSDLDCLRKNRLLFVSRENWKKPFQIRIYRLKWI